LERKSEISRKTHETKVLVKLNLEGSGNSKIDSGCGFFDHMLSLFAYHGKIDLEVEACGDINVDCHHTIEDIGIVLGKAFKNALGSKKGIERYASVFMPMDEALVHVVVDISGRSFLLYDMPSLKPQVGTFDTELAEEFLRSLVSNSEITLHVRYITGKNTHHILEAVFKALGRSFRTAVKVDLSNKDSIPSSKGVL
jgi:imidazoleglycerol-phosphate dehydratase